MATTFQGANPTGARQIPFYWADFVRKNLYPNLYFRQLGTQTTIPRAFGDTVKIPRWGTPVQHKNARAVVSANVAGRGAPSAFYIASGTSNERTAAISAAGLTATNISGTVAQFLGARGYNDKIIIVSKADFIEGALESLTKELAWQLEAYTRANISANAKLIRANTGATAPTTGIASSVVLKGSSMARISPILDSYGVPRWEDDAFVGVMHPLAQYDLFSDLSATGFVNVAQYGDPERVYRGEIGLMYGTRLLVSSAVPVIISTGGSTTTSFGLSATVTGSNMYVFAPDAFYAVELEDGGVEVIHHELGSAGSADPGNNLGTIACKVFYGAIPAPATDRRLLRVAHSFGIGPSLV